MAVSRLQKFSQWAQAGWSMATTGKFLPKNDGTTSFVQYVTPVDEGGNVIGGGLPSTIISGQQTVTESAAPLANNVLTQGVTLKALKTNAAPIYIGPTGVTSGAGYPLYPGDTQSFSVSNTNAIDIISAANTSDVLVWTGN